MAREQKRLLELFELLDSRGRSSLLDYAAFLASPAYGVAPQPASLPRPAVETVVQAIRRLNRSYPTAQRHRLIPAVEKLLAAHLPDSCPAPHVIDELEALFAGQYRPGNGN